MLNRTIMMGRLTRDPELRKTQTGTPVCSFSIACDRGFKNVSGEKETDFFDCVAWRQTAEFVSQYFTKGRMVVVRAGCKTAIGPTRRAISTALRSLLLTTPTLAIPSRRTLALVNLRLMVATR